MSKTKSKRKFHFVGVLANVNESILKLNDILEHGFEIKQININDCVLFCSLKYSTLITDHELIRNKCLDKKLNTYYFHKSFECEVSHKSKGNFIFDYPDNFNELNMVFGDYLSNLMSVMRLFKEGNIRSPFNFWYYNENEIPILSGVFGSNLSILKNDYSLEDSEIPKLKHF